MFVAPFLFFYAAFLIYPAIEVAYLSLTDSDITGQGAFVGLQNYRELIGDADFWASFWHTLYFIVADGRSEYSRRVFCWRSWSCA